MQVYLIMRRSDVPDGTLQVLDLWPNTSNKNSIYPPGLGQTGYLRMIPAISIAADVAAGPPVTATANLVGLAAYLIDNIDTGAVAGGAPFTGAQADAAALSIRNSAAMGLDLTLANVDALLGAVVAGTTLTGGGSTGVLTELLSVMAGASYVVPAGSALSDGGGAFNGRAGALDNATYKQLYDTGHFLASELSGNVSLLKSANFTYGGTAGSAVGVYDETGTLRP